MVSLDRMVQFKGSVRLLNDGMDNSFLLIMHQPQELDVLVESSVGNYILGLNVH